MDSQSMEETTLNTSSEPERENKSFLQQLPSQKKRHKMRKAIHTNIHILAQQLKNTTKHGKLHHKP